MTIALICIECTCKVLDNFSVDLGVNGCEAVVFQPARWSLYTSATTEQVLLEAKLICTKFQ